MAPAGQPGAGHWKRPASTPEPQTRTVPSRGGHCRPHVPSEGVAAFRGLLRTGSRQGDASIQPHLIDCLFRQDSQIAQGLRSRLGKTLTSVFLSQKLVVPTYGQSARWPNADKRRLEQTARPRYQLAPARHPGDQCHQPDHRSARPTHDGLAVHWDSRLSLPPDVLRERGAGNRWRRIPSVFTCGLRKIEARAGRKAHPIPIIRESPLRTDPWLTSSLSRHGTAISGDIGRFLTKDWQDWKNRVPSNLYVGMVKPRDRGSDGHPEGMIEFASGRAERFPLFVPSSPSAVEPLSSRLACSASSDQPRIRASACTISTARATGAAAQSRMVQWSGMVSLQLSQTVGPVRASAR
jgi:hypothetical protein